VRHHLLTLVLSFAALTLLPAQSPPPQEPPELLQLPGGEKLLVWQGHIGRSYFLQVSDPSSHLEKWFWAPIIEAGGDAEISYEVNGTAELGFFRIHHTDQVPGPGETLDSADFDGDGISNFNEISPSIGIATHPLDPDTDHDGLLDGWERAHGLDPDDSAGINGGDGDPDHDGLTNQEEQALGTDPNNSDSDGDGISDGGERDQNTNPNDPSDTPKAEWFVLTGDLDEEVEKSRSRTVTIPAGESRVLLVVLASEEYPDFTGGASVFNDILKWEIIPTGKDALTGNIDVNSRHDDWDLALIDGTEIQGFSPAHIETGIPLTAPGDAPLTVEIDLSATNIGDGALPSTVMVGLLAVEVSDNLTATGVDKISKTVGMSDLGYQDDFWIMAPLQGPPLGNGFAYENLSRIRIGMGDGDTGKLSSANATPDSDPDPAATSDQISLDGDPHDVLWQGTGNGIDSEEQVKLRINDGANELPLPIRVKTMKYRKVTVDVYPLRKNSSARNVPLPESNPGTSKELETHFNKVFGYQSNVWFDVVYHPQTDYGYDPDGNGFVGVYDTKIRDLGTDYDYRIDDKHIRIFLLDSVRIRDLNGIESTNYFG
jgi:hypothetical protein